MPGPCCYDAPQRRALNKSNFPEAGKHFPLPLNVSPKLCTTTIRFAAVRDMQFYLPLARFSNLFCLHCMSHVCLLSGNKAENAFWAFWTTEHLERLAKLFESYNHIEQALFFLLPT